MKSNPYLNEFQKPLFPSYLAGDEALTYNDNLNQAPGGNKQTAGTTLVWRETQRTAQSQPVLEVLKKC